MILTTTPAVEGRPVKTYLGVVAGDAILAWTSWNDVLESLRSLGSNRSAMMERALSEARETALRQLGDRAQGLGANAVVGISIDFEHTPSGVMVMATGTAALIP